MSVDCYTQIHSELHGPLLSAEFSLSNIRILGENLDVIKYIIFNEKWSFLSELPSDVLISISSSVECSEYFRCTFYRDEKIIWKIFYIIRNKHCGKS